MIIASKARKPWKMDKSWSNFGQNFNESSQCLAKVFLTLHFWFLLKSHIVLSRKWMKSFALHKYCSYLAKSLPLEWSSERKYEHFSLLFATLKSCIAKGSHSISVNKSKWTKSSQVYSPAGAKFNGFTLQAEALDWGRKYCKLFSNCSQQWLYSKHFTVFLINQWNW